MATCIAASTGTKRKTEASVPEVSTLPVVDTSESESVRYEVFIQKFHRLVEAVRPVVVQFAVNALSKSLITEYNKCDAENPAVSEFNRASVLMSQILPKIKESDAHFDAFVAILEELEITKLAHELKKAVDPTVKLPTTASTTREDSDSGSTSGAESVDATGFKCPCGQCSLENYFRDRSKCPSLQETAFPFLNTRHLSTDERETLEHQLIGDTNQIKKEFKKLSDAVFKALKGTKTPISEIRSTVLSSGSSKPIQTSSHIDELKTITTIADLKFFLIRHEYISFFNYEILKAFIEDYDDCKECQVDLDSYLQEFKKFSRRNVFEVPAETLNPPSTLDNLLVVKVNDGMWFGAKRDTPDCHFTLNDIKSIQNKIAEVIEHDRRFIHLVDVGKGCLQLAFKILSCQEAPTFPLTTSQLSEMIRCGIIVLYQPNLASLPTNIQDTDCQTRDSTESETISSAVKTHRSRSFSIPSTIDTSPKHTIRRCQSTGSIPSTINTSSTTPVPPLLVQSPFPTSSKKLVKPRTQFVNVPDIGSMTSKVEDTSSLEEGYSPIATSSSIVTELQEPGVHKKRYRHEELPLTMKELEWRIAEKKRKIESFNYMKAFWQQRQREAEEEERHLKSRLTQTSNEDEQRELERKIHDQEEWIKRSKEEVQQCEELVNKSESELRVLNETKDKEFKQLLKARVMSPYQTLTSHLKEFHVTPPSPPHYAKPMTSPSYRPDVKPFIAQFSPEQPQHQTSSGKKELSLTIVERRIADKKDLIEYFKRMKALNQRWQREAEEDVKCVDDGEEEIKVWKERVQRCEEGINEAESDILALTETKDKESKRLLDLGITFPSLQTDTSCSEPSQELPLRHGTKPPRRPRTSPSYQPVTAAAVKPTVPSSVLTEKEHLDINSYIMVLGERDIILLGQALGLLRPNLKKMKTLPEEMIDAWLNQDDHVLETSGPPTWESFCEALKIIDQPGIAAKIQMEESKRLLGEGMTMISPSVQTDTSCSEPSQELPLKHGTNPPRRPMTRPSNQPVTVAAVKPTVPSSVLTEKEHLDINSYIKVLCERDIILLGQALGLLRSNLKKMKTLPDEMIDAWLNRADHVLETSGLPTWESLCEALKRIDQPGIAATIDQMKGTLM